MVIPVTLYGQVHHLMHVRAADARAACRCGAPLSREGLGWWKAAHPHSYRTPLKRHGEMMGDPSGATGHRRDLASAESGSKLGDPRSAPPRAVPMNRAGVPSDHAERCLGHVIGGVRGIYDWHASSREKRDAFEALAVQIERILDPADNVVPLRGEKAQ
jgi:hypothetical protein